jgi:hypothetical protein
MLSSEEEQAKKCMSLAQNGQDEQVGNARRAEKNSFPFQVSGSLCRVGVKSSLDYRKNFPARSSGPRVFCLFSEEKF